MTIDKVLRELVAEEVLKAFAQLGISELVKDREPAAKQAEEAETTAPEDTETVSDGDDFEGMTREELHAHMKAAVGDDYNKRVGDPSLRQALRLIQAGEQCVACSGTGTASKGGECKACKGKGVAKKKGPVVTEREDPDEGVNDDADTEIGDEPDVPAMTEAECRAVLMEVMQDERVPAEELEDHKKAVKSICKELTGKAKIKDVKDVWYPKIAATAKAILAEYEETETEEDVVDEDDF